MASHSPIEIPSDDNVVQRLQTRLGEARQSGFRVRLELLGDEQPSWCILAGKPTLFVDLSHTADEQLRHLDEMIADYQRVAGGQPAALTGDRAA